MGPEVEEDSSTEWKIRQVYYFRKRSVLRLSLMESREGFCRRGRVRSFHILGLKTENAWEPTEESLVCRIWRLNGGNDKVAETTTVSAETYTSVTLTQSPVPVSKLCI